MAVIPRNNEANLGTSDSRITDQKLEMTFQAMNGKVKNILTFLTTVLLRAKNIQFQIFNCRVWLLRRRLYLYACLIDVKNELKYNVDEILRVVEKLKSNR